VELAIPGVEEDELAIPGVEEDGDGDLSILQLYGLKNIEVLFVVLNHLDLKI
jgi:hypothetical protein